MLIDIQLLKIINSLAGKNEVFDQFFILLTNYGAFVFGLGLLWLWFTRTGSRIGNRQTVFFALTVTTLALGCNLAIEWFMFRPRPFVTHTVTLLIDKSATSTSFPSNHTAGAFAIALTVAWKLRKYQYVLLSMASLLAFSRMYVGVHYPGDVIGGILVALIALAVVNWQRRPLEHFFQKIIQLLSKIEGKVFASK